MEELIRNGVFYCFFLSERGLNWNSFFSLDMILFILKFTSMLHCTLVVVLQALCLMLMVVLQLAVVVDMIRNPFLGFVPTDTRNRTANVVRLRHHANGRVTADFELVAFGFVSLVILQRFPLPREH